MEVPSSALDMATLMQAIQSVYYNVNSRFATSQEQLTGLLSELSCLKLEMVTRVHFESLASRVFQPESNVVSSENPDVKFLQTQLDRLDPAHKCMSIAGFMGEFAIESFKLIEEFLKEKFASFGDRLRIEHVCKGKFNERKLTGISLSEFLSELKKEIVPCDSSGILTSSCSSRERTYDLIVRRRDDS